MKKLHLIAGLPRSGSTLLSSILKQNPSFSAGISDPLNEALVNVVRAFSVPGVSTQCSEEQRIETLRGLIHAYYSKDNRDVVFNTSRFWTSSLDLMHLLEPNAKVICCVRDIPWILDSFEVLYKKNPTTYSYSMYGEPPQYAILDDVYRRADRSMQNGVIARAMNSLKEGLYGSHSNKILLVEYENLAKDPQKTLKTIYKFIEEPYFKHNFNDVEISYDEYDNAVQTKGLHTIRKKVEFVERNPVIPPDIWQRYSGLEFWR